MLEPMRDKARVGYNHDFGVFMSMEGREDGDYFAHIPFISQNQPSVTVSKMFDKFDLMIT